MSVMGFKLIFLGGWGEVHPIFFGFFDFFLTLQSP